MQKTNLLYPLLAIILFTFGALIGQQAEKKHQAKNIYSIPCNQNETPQQCQQRLGEFFEVIYTPKNNTLRAELIKADITQYQEPTAY